MTTDRAQPGTEPGTGDAGMLRLLARRTGWGRSDAIRDILTTAAAPGMLSLAGGIPAQESFPTGPMAEAMDRVMSRSAASALQYAPTEGVMRMREVLAVRAGGTGAAVPPERVLVTSGSQQGLDLVTRTLVDEGDTVALEDPSYLGAVQVFRREGARLLPVPGDSEGMRTDVLEERLRAGVRCKLVYVVPHFHNPTGRVLSQERRVHLAELADRYGFLIVEDDPYADLAFDGERLASIDVHSDRVIRLMSLSKTLCPGLRVAGLTAPAVLFAELSTAKQCADLQTNTFGQHVLAELLADPGFLSRHVRRLQKLYRDKAETLVGLLRENLPGVSFESPSGGLFLWCSVDDLRVTADSLYPRALAERVAFVPGAPFCVERDGSRLMRLSFASLDGPQAREAVERLSVAFEKTVTH